MILGISGSPVKDGNTEAFLKKALQSISDPTVQHETLSLSRLDIRDCIHCNFCISRQKLGKYCALQDDTQQVFEKAEQADIIVLASPVYFMRTSGRMAAFIDRLRVFMYGNIARGKLRNKIGVSAAVSWLRNAGLETTHLTHLYAFMTLEMIPVGVHTGISTLGASAVASIGGAGEFDPAVRTGIEKDEWGLRSAAAVMERAVELARLVRKRS